MYINNEMNRQGCCGSLSADNATGDLFPTFEAFGVLGKRVGVEGATNANRGVRPLASDSCRGYSLNGIMSTVWNCPLGFP